MIIRYSRCIVIITIVFSFISCSTNPTSAPVGTGFYGSIPKNEQGEIVYVAIGNSLTAGMQSSGITTYTAANSFPTLVARQLGLTGNKFTYPEWAIGSGADTYQNDDKRYRKKLSGFDNNNAPLIEKELANDLFPSNINNELPYHNLGIPGAYSFDITDSSDLISKSQERPNPYFFQVLRTQALGKNVIQQAQKLSPTLITFWLGNNDILSYALSGATSKSLPEEINVGATPPHEFEKYYTDALQSALTNLPNAAFVIMNIPDVLFAPYFSRQSRGKYLTKTKADSLNIIAGTLSLEKRFSEGYNPYIIQTKNGIRKSTDKDLILDKRAVSVSDSGMLYSLADELVLDESEIVEIRQIISVYNEIIANKVVQNNPQYKNRLYLMDMYRLLAEIAEHGYLLPDGSKITTENITGGLFSVDGIHPTSRGYGILANEIISQILNKQMNADIPLIPLNELKAVFVE